MLQLCWESTLQPCRITAMSQPCHSHAMFEVMWVSWRLVSSQFSCKTIQIYNVCRPTRCATAVPQSCRSRAAALQLCSSRAEPQPTASSAVFIVASIVVIPPYAANEERTHAKQHPTLRICSCNVAHARQLSMHWRPAPRLRSKCCLNF